MIFGGLNERFVSESWGSGVGAGVDRVVYGLDFNERLLSELR